MSKIADVLTISKEETRPNLKVITYWVATVLLAFVEGSGGIGELTHQWGTLDTVKIVGYPVYF